VAIVVNPNLIGVVDFTEGLKPDGMIIINTPQTPAEIRQRVKFKGGQVWCVDATKIAMEEFKRYIPSTMMLGVVARATGLVHVEAITNLTKEKLGGKLRPEVVAANVRAIERAFNECVQG
jgi:pyruvate ferredoxin oxidoreductase gamma subunit